MTFDAARDAGVRRIVHISITNPDPESDLPHLRGRGQLEDALRKLEGVSHAILRPTVLYSAEDVLLNNIARTLHRLPAVFPPSRGERVEPPMHHRNGATDHRPKQVRIQAPPGYVA